MQVKEVMTSNPETVGPDMTLREAAAKMRDLNVGVLPICEGPQLVGVITDRDITVRAVAEGIDPATNRIRDFMTAPDVRFVYDEQDVSEAVQTMETQQIRRLPVLDQNQRLVGIVSIGDIAVDTENQRMSGEALKDISKPAEPNR